MLSRLCFTAALLTAVISASALAVPIVDKSFADGVQPQLAVAPSGRVHVVFGRADKVYHTSSKDGETFSTPVFVGQLEKLALKMRRGPRVIATNDRVTVTAISHSSGQLHAWTSTDGGANWEAQGALNTVANSAREGLHAMASDGRGLVALTWLDLRNNGMELWSRISRTGGASWEAEVRVYASPDGHICECCHPSVAIGPKGEIAAMWRNWIGGSRDMWAAVSVDGGKTFAEPRKLGTGTWRLKGCPMDGGGLAFDAAGVPKTVWRREAAVYSAGLGGAETELSSRALQPVVARVASSMAIAFEKDGDVMLSVNDAKPTALGNGRWPAIASNAAGNCFIAWESAVGGMEIQRVQ